jgi:hypothetical protein
MIGSKYLVLQVDEVVFQVDEVVLQVDGVALQVVQNDKLSMFFTNHSIMDPVDKIHLLVSLPSQLS